MKHLINIVAIITLLSPNLHSASAGNIATGISSEVTQLAQFAADGVAYGLDYAQQLQQYANMVERYRNQFESYRLMLQNIAKLSPRQWDEFSQSVIQLKHALEFGEGMAYTMANYEQQFTQLFKGYDHYLQAAQSERIDFINTYIKLNQSTQDMADGAIRSLGLQAQDMQSDEATMLQLQQLSVSSAGQKSAIQAASQIALHQTHTLKKLHQTVMTQVNLQAQYMLESSEKKAFQEAISYNKRTKGIKPTIGNESQVTRW